MENFKSLVLAIEENNSMNEAQWKDWKNAQHVQSLYGEMENTPFKPIYEAFIDALIRDNGQNLSTYLDTVSCLEYGQIFSRN